MLDIEITQTLYNFAGYHSARGESYRAKAFERAAMTLDGFDHFINECTQTGKLKSLPGIGHSISAIVEEILQYGKFKYKDQDPMLSESFWSQISKVPHCGARVLQKIFEVGICSFEELEKAIYNKTLNLNKPAETSLLDFIRKRNPFNEDFVGIPFPVAFMISQEVKEELNYLKLQICGEVRMYYQRIRCIEFITSQPDNAIISKAIKEHRYYQNYIEEVTDRSIRALIYPGINCIIHNFSPELEAFFLLVKSSPGEHIKELSSQASKKGIYFNDSGLFEKEKNIASGLKKEQEIYKLLDLNFIPPEVRNLPLEESSNISGHLISPDSIRGELHVHTNWSDGIDSIEGMALRALSLGYEYLGIADHSESLKVGNGITIGELLAQIEKIDKFNSTKKGIRILKGSEVDILPDGDLDFPSEVLSKLDFVIAAVHMSTNMSNSRMTNRILRAVEHPCVNILAHPTGSLTSRPGNFFSLRKPWEMDFKRIAKSCADNHVALEINAFPERMDISEEHIRTALEYGAKIIINTDSHSSYHLRLIKYGIMLARKGLCKQSDILNTMPWSEVKDYFNKKPKIDLNIKKDLSKHSNSILPRKLVAHSMKNTFASFGNNKRFPVVVGIDLTASQERESGWAVLTGVSTHTQRLKSDEELIDATLNAAPEIVSIDSPLSLPYGRCCTNPDCKCRSFGITRFCERFLMANGIGVFPCLLPSMVDLTTRGITLKNIFEEKGINVIESYPGAAQDILRIPRKNKGMKMLYDGLIRFGIKFDKALEHISHDELDAVTSALVGYFYLSDQYLGLGDERENFLIIPSIQAFDVGISGPCVIAITGLTGSGKTTTALYLALKYGFRYMRYSQIIAKLSGYQGRYDKALLQEAGLELHKRIGQKDINLKLIAEMPKDEHVVIDGMRFLEDFNTLKSKFGNRFFPIVVESKSTLIEKRLKKSPFFADKSKHEIRRIISHNVELQIFELSFQIPNKLINDRSFKELFDQIDQYLKRLGKMEDK